MKMTAMFVGLMLGAPTALRAQAHQTTLVGVIRDSSGHPIPGVEVRLAGQELFTRTNDIGGFRLPSMPVGEVKLSARRLGFAPAMVDLTLREGRVDSLVLSLSTLAANLPGMVIEDEYQARSKRLLAGFWERRSRGFGHYYTRDEIERANSHDFVDIVRTTPGSQIVMKNGRRVLRFGRGGRPGADCPPQYFVDGMRVEQASPDEFPPEDVEAIELYSGPATIPVQFANRMGSLTCGAVIIWTRIPGGPG